MEFHTKLQQLRKQKGLTQEELAEQLYVSRAAVSKWESGRGYPSIDSLKAIADFYAVTIDFLLSGEEILDLAEEQQKQAAACFRELVFGLLDLGAVLFLFLPLFGEKTDGMVRAVSLMALTKTAVYLKTAYILIIAGMILVGIVTLFRRAHTLSQKSLCSISLFIHIPGTLLFIISAQPYGAALLFLFLLIKVFLLVKKQ